MIKLQEQLKSLKRRVLAQDRAIGILLRYAVEGGVQYDEDREGQPYVDTTERHEYIDFIEQDVLRFLGRHLAPRG